MFNSVEFVRSICQERRIPISALEKACGFSNGYLNPKKMARIPYDRAVLIGQYLNSPASKILTGEDAEESRPKNNVTDEALRYFLPLIEGEPEMLYKNGLIRHIKLK